MDDKRPIKGTAVMLLVTLAGLPSAGVRAADVPPLPPPRDAGAPNAGETVAAGSDWGIYWPTYLWAAGTDGRARTLPPLPASDVHVSFGDSLEALKDLDAGLITSVFVHKDRFRLMGDVN